MNAKIPQYYLCKHIYPCLVDNHVVFLDQKRDRYLCLENPQAAAVWLFLQKASPNPDTREAPVPCDIAKLLLDNGLITTNPPQGKSLADIKIEPPSQERPYYNRDEKPPIHAAHIYYFLSSCLKSAISLRCLPLSFTVNRLKRRRRNHNADTLTLSRKDLHGLIEIFNSMRPLLFTAKDNCMFHALALIEFLSCFRIYPHWVFGVKMGPFLAHCWVQDANTVLNDSIDHVATFTPIMSA